MKKIADGFEFEVRPDGTAELIRYTENVIRLVIPAQIKGYPVKSISRYFAQRYKGSLDANKDLEEVIISDGVEEIDHAAFGACWYLKWVEIPASVTQIASTIFLGSRQQLVFDEQYARASTDYHVWREMGEDVHDPYRRVDTTEAVVISGSYAEKFCKERGIPYRVKNEEKQV